jgi:hypothetical protein
MNDVRDRIDELEDRGFCVLPLQRVLRFPVASA